MYETSWGASDIPSKSKLESEDCDAGVAVRMSAAESEDQELALDLWQGQFEFVGEGYGLAPSLDESPPLPPFREPPLNGVRKSAAHAWCEDLTQQVQMLQQQVSVLADNQTNTDDRYTRAKQDSAALQARVHMLEEQLREAELRAEERLQEEQRRHRELMIRVEREKQLQMENCSIRLQTLELEAASLREEVGRLRSETERLRNEKQDVEEHLEEAELALSALREKAQHLEDAERRIRDEAARERDSNVQLIEELSREVEMLRQEQLERSEGRSASKNTSLAEREEELGQHLCELQAEISLLRQQNKTLQENNEELQAQMLTRSLEEGRNLLTAGAGTGNSLAAELEAMSQDELNADASEHLSFEQIKTALKEQQEVNMQLRTYIDGILLNIVENYPQLLEVKTN